MRLTFWVYTIVGQSHDSQVFLVLVFLQFNGLWTEEGLLQQLHASHWQQRPPAAFGSRQITTGLALMCHRCCWCRRARWRLAGFRHAACAMNSRCGIGAQDLPLWWFHVVSKTISVHILSYLNIFGVKRGSTSRGTCEDQRRNSYGDCSWLGHKVH